ncbi:transporter [marine bacterium AO1-C]|nr:transporter [marine bacterium AO1-C]
MKAIKYIVAGVLFGIIMTKSEVISWYRIQEMFRFQAFHMYGIIASAVLLMMIATWLIKKYHLKSVYGQPIIFNDKKRSIPRYLIGGTFFGLGWAMTGACPGPLYVLLGHGFVAIGLVLFSALIGTYVYGLLRDRLPH